jgi:hypothetical protein
MVAEKSIEEVAREAVPKITILGVGGGGSNIVTWLKKDAVPARTIALNSDAQHLTVTKADDKVLLGYKTTGGLGCGGFPEQGQRAVEESATEVERVIGDSALVFVTTTLGGGTGTTRPKRGSEGSRRSVTRSSSWTTTDSGRWRAICHSGMHSASPTITSAPSSRGYPRPSRYPAT